jgi:ferrous iron transport protein B
MIVALVGSPNSGKSTLFNTLTGGNQKVGNYPGVTVERKWGKFLGANTESNREIAVVDLPGIYSLSPRSPDEEVTVGILNGHFKGEKRPDAVVLVVDATNLQRTLGLALELTDRSISVIIALNLMDEATRLGLQLDVTRLGELLNCRVIPTVALDPKRCLDLRDAVANITPSPLTSLNRADESIKKSGLTERQKIAARHARLDAILRECVLKPSEKNRLSQQIDALLLHRVLGLPILGLILLMIFQAVFSWASVPMDLLESGIGYLGSLAGEHIANPMLHSLVADGIFAGVGSVIVFIPQILILFTFIFIMEGSGYMARAAFLMDRLMASVGLQGKSFVPLLSSFACAIPGMMATRTLANPRDRILTIILTPLMTCSARLPVYVLLIGAFIPNRELAFGIHLQGLVMFGLFVAGILSAMLTALLCKLTVLQGQRAPFILEMPSYRFPRFGYIARNVLLRGKSFLQRAGKSILVVSIVLWGLSSFPKAPEGATAPEITYSYAGQLGALLEPAVRPLGFDWRIATGLVPGFAAREVMVGALGTVFAVADAENEEGGMQTLQAKLQSAWPLGTGLALLVWYIFAPQCLATFAVMRRETNGWKWPVISFTYLLFLAYFGALITNQITILMTRG